MSPSSNPTTTYSLSSELTTRDQLFGMSALVRIVLFDTSKLVSLCEFIHKIGCNSGERGKIVEQKMHTLSNCIGVGTPGKEED